MESPTGNSVQPSVIQASDGTLAAAWTRATTNFVVVYATGTWNGTGWNWSPGATITSQGGTNQNPSLVQLANGTIDLFWAYKPAGSPHFQIYYVSQNGGQFSKQYTPVPQTVPTTLNDTLPSAGVGRDGTLWLAWRRDNSTAKPAPHLMRQLWYKTLRAGVWSAEQPITLANDTNWNSAPSIVVGKDGLIRLAFSRGLASSGVSQINYMTFNGSAWSSMVQLTSQTATTDDNPSIMQDRNGTFWLFWARNIIVSASLTALVIYARSSANGGGSWTSETALTGISCGTLTCVDSQNPAAVQSTVDKNIWILYSTNPVSGFNLWGLRTSTPIAPVHDVLISYFTVNASLVYVGGFHDTYTASGTPLIQSPSVQVNVVIQNTGDFNESVSISLAATNTTRYSLGLQNLQVLAGSNTITAFFFNSSGVAPGRYGIAANATIPVEPLANRPDGLLSQTNLIHVLPLGDIDQDGSVTISDLAVIFYAYGFTCYTPSTCSPRFVAAQWADLNGNGVIDASDISAATRNYGVYA